MTQVYRIIRLWHNKSWNITYESAVCKIEEKNGIHLKFVAIKHLKTIYYQKYELETDTQAADHERFGKRRRARLKACSKNV